MTDELDAATERMEREQEMILAAARAKVVPIQTSEYCLLCGEETTGGRRWCDAGCRDRWEMEN